MSKEVLIGLDIAARILLLIFTITFGMIVILIGSKEALAASLRPDAVITGDYIKLGDIFDGTENADYILGPAPQPGKDMILNARTLYKIATALDVEWQPASSTEQIVLRREAMVIPQDDITSALEEKIREDVKESFSISYMTKPTEMILPAGTDEGFEITAFHFDVQKDTFNATVVAPTADNPLKRTNVSGRVERLVSVPVLKNSLRNGDVIGALDIDYIELPRNKIAAGVVLEASDIVNMTPRRTMASGKPISLNDLQSPKMVDRGDLITLVFEGGVMTLTAKGKALQAGAMGDTVRVSNVDSDKNLQGVITGHREVTIR